MKIALCLSGQPRSWREGYEYHTRNLLDKHDVDVFIHTWDYVPDKMLVNITDLYKPVYVDTMTPGKEKLEEIDQKYTRIPNKQFPARNTWLMFYSIYKANLPTQTIDYDVVIRSRFDLALNRDHGYDQTLVDTVYVPDDRKTVYHDFCADMFAWGSPKVMRSYSETWLNLDKFYNEGVTMIGEDMLAAQLKLHGLIGPKMVYVNMNNPFGPGKYNGNRHSLIRDDFVDWNKLRG